MKRNRNKRTIVLAAIAAVSITLGLTALAEGPHGGQTPHSDPMFSCFHNGVLYFMVINGACPEIPYETTPDGEEVHYFPKTHNEVDCIISRQLMFQR